MYSACKGLQFPGRATLHQTHRTGRGARTIGPAFRLTRYSNCILRFQRVRNRNSVDEQYEERWRRSRGGEWRQNASLAFLRCCFSRLRVIALHVDTNAISELSDAQQLLVTTPREKKQWVCPKPIGTHRYHFLHDRDRITPVIETSPRVWATLPWKCPKMTPTLRETLYARNGSGKMGKNWGPRKGPRSRFFCRQVATQLQIIAFFPATSDLARNSWLRIYLFRLRQRTIQSGKRDFFRWGGGGADFGGVARESERHRKDASLRFVFKSRFSRTCPFVSHFVGYFRAKYIGREEKLTRICLKCRDRGWHVCLFSLGNGEHVLL